MRWVIGDIHGMLRPLQALLEAIHQLDDAARLYFSGDYVNRGPDSRRVIDLLLTLRGARFVRGNHDDVFDLVLHGSAWAPAASLTTPLAAFLTFMQYGLANTLCSYGVDWDLLLELERRPNPDRLADAVKVVPEEHRQFVRRLEPCIEDADLFVAHALWDPDVSAESPDIRSRVEQNMPLRQQLLWGRFSAEQIRRKKRWKRTGYFGHTPIVNYVQNLKGEPNLPLVGDKIVLLDTAAALSPDGRLTAYCPDTQKFLQADREGKLVVQG